ncbi:MAG: acetyl-CoA C-acetyltransferase [Chloracidobacterium sp.]|nr:acetyl-CoA C-acetyltransferase [Chloracidobacterium sp.]MDW8217806.1 acetyl-CoA C-acetyltransferase [Acidobacteriota bacterium]
MTRDAFIFDAIRTPRGRGKASGALYEIKPIDLVTQLLRELQRRNGFDTGEVDDIILGCVTPIGDQGANIAKTAALYAGYAETVAGQQINRFCASGLEAVNHAAMRVRSGWEDLVIGGGVESMSRVPMGSDGGAMMLDPMVSATLRFIPQGVSADLIATLENFSREELDSYALRSHQRAAHATANGYFKRSLIPVTDMNGLLVLDHDELIRPDTSLEALAQLQPSFAQMGEIGFDAVAQLRYPGVERIRHVHTAGNSSGIVDGAALVLVGSREKGEALGLKPRARIVAAAVTGSEPTIMLTGPMPATRKALAKAGMTMADIDLFEVNEAFASVVLKFIRDMDVDPEKVNVNGGAIAMGHPLGATGAMLLGTALDELERRDKTTALITLCVGGGMGIATIIERV